MSAYAILYSGNKKKPLWTMYEDGEKPLYEGNYMIPLVWLALFSEENLTFYIDPDGENDNSEDNKVPLLVRRKSECISALDKHTEFILTIASNCNDSILKLRNALKLAKGEYISLDMVELFYMVHDGKFIDDVRNTLKFFNEQSIEYFLSVLNLFQPENYDVKNKDFIPDERYGYENHAIGCEP